MNASPESICVQHAMPLRRIIKRFTGCMSGDRLKRYCEVGSLVFVGKHETAVSVLWELHLERRGTTVPKHGSVMP